MKESAVIAMFYFRRMAHRPLLILFLLAIPVSLLLAEFAAFGRSPASKPIAPLPIAIIGSRHSPAAERFIQCLQQQTGHALLVSGEEETAAGSLAFSNSTPLQVTARLNPASQLDSILESSLVKICAAPAALTAKPAYSVTVDRSAPDHRQASASSAAFFASFFPGLALFGSLFLAQAMASLVWRDQERTVQQRLRTMPISSPVLVLGPFLFLTAGAASALLLLLAVCALATNPAAFASPLLWALAIGSALFTSALQLAIGLIAKTRRAAQAISASTNMMLAFLGGGFVPLSLYPPFLRAVAYALPIGAAQAGLVELFQGAARAQDLIWRISTVWVWALVLGFAAIFLQSRRVGA